MGIAAGRFFFDQRSTRKSEAKQFGGFIERLTDGVIYCAAKPQVMPDAQHGEDLGVAAGREKETIRKRGVVGEPRGQRMRFQMIDRDQRFLVD